MTKYNMVKIRKVTQSNGKKLQYNKKNSCSL